MNRTAIATLLLFITFAAMHPVLRGDFIVMDDPIYVTSNYQVQSGFSLDSISWAFTTMYFGNWSPITWLAHMLDYQLFGTDAWGYHLTSLLLHGLCTVLFFWLVSRIRG